MNKYESVTIELVLFKEQQDVITSSGGTVIEDETVYEMPNWWDDSLGS